jgi:hypothetical protein
MHTGLGRNHARSRAGLGVLMQHDAVVLACNNARFGVASILRRKETTLMQEAAIA